MRISDWSSDVCSSDLAIAARRTDHQHFLRAVSAHALGTGRGDLFAHVVLAAERMRGGADEAADLGMDDQFHDLVVIGAQRHSTGCSAARVWSPRSILQRRDKKTGAVAGASTKKCRAAQDGRQLIG